MVVRISDKKQNYSNVTKLLVKPKFNFLDKQAVTETEAVQGVSDDDDF